MDVLVVVAWSGSLFRFDAYSSRFSSKTSGRRKAKANWVIQVELEIDIKMER